MRFQILCVSLFLWYCCEGTIRAPDQTNSCEPTCSPPHKFCVIYKMSQGVCPPGSADDNSIITGGSCGCTWLQHIERMEPTVQLLDTEEGRKCYGWALSECEHAAVGNQPGKGTLPDLLPTPKAAKLNNVVQLADQLRETISTMFDANKHHFAKMSLQDVVNKLKDLQKDIKSVPKDRPKAEGAMLDREKKTLEELASMVKAKQAQNGISANESSAPVYYGKLEKDKDDGWQAVVETEAPSKYHGKPTAPVPLVDSDKFKLIVFGGIFGFIVLSILCAIVCRCGSSEEEKDKKRSGDLAYEQYGMSPKKNQFERFLSKLGRHYRKKAFEKAKEHYERAQRRADKHSFSFQLENARKKVNASNSLGDSQRTTMTDSSYAADSTFDHSYEVPETSETPSPVAPARSMERRPDITAPGLPTPDAGILRSALKRTASPTRTGSSTRRVSDAADNSLLISMPLNFKKPRPSVIP